MLLDTFSLFQMDKQTMKNVLGGRHSSVVSSAPTILQPRVQIPSSPSMLFSICIEKRTKINKKRSGLAHFLKKEIKIYLMLVT